MPQKISEPTGLAPEKKRFRYPGLLVQQLGLWLGVLLGLGGIAVGIHDFDKGGWIGIPIGSFIALLAIAATRFSFNKNRPLIIDETGITALAGGKPWKFVAWTDVTRIEKIRKVIYLQLGTRYGHEFLIVGPQSEIRLEDTISDFPVLLSTLNYYARRYQIPLVARDKGTDTIDRIRATVNDKQLRKKLLDEGGVPTSLTSL